LEKPLLAPRLGVRRVALRGPLQFGAAKLKRPEKLTICTRPKLPLTSMTPRSANFPDDLAPQRGRETWGHWATAGSTD
jgi:hypothetical protein